MLVMNRPKNRKAKGARAFNARCKTMLRDKSRKLRPPNKKRLYTGILHARHPYITRDQSTNKIIVPAGGELDAQLSVLPIDILRSIEYDTANVENSNYIYFFCKQRSDFDKLLKLTNLPIRRFRGKGNSIKGKWPSSLLLNCFRCKPVPDFCHMPNLSTEKLFLVARDYFLNIFPNARLVNVYYNQFRGYLDVEFASDFSPAEAMIVEKRCHGAFQYRTPYYKCMHCGSSAHHQNDCTRAAEKYCVIISQDTFYTDTFSEHLKASGATRGCVGLYNNSYVHRAANFCTLIYADDAELDRNADNHYKWLEPHGLEQDIFSFKELSMLCGQCGRDPDSKLCDCKDLGLASQLPSLLERFPKHNVCDQLSINNSFAIKGAAPSPPSKPVGHVPAPNAPVAAKPSRPIPFGPANKPSTPSRDVKFMEVDSVKVEAMDTEETIPATAPREDLPKHAVFGSLSTSDFGLTPTIENVNSKDEFEFFLKFHGVTHMTGALDANVTQNLYGVVEKANPWTVYDNRAEHVCGDADLYNNLGISYGTPARFHKAKQWPPELLTVGNEIAAKMSDADFTYAPNLCAIQRYSERQKGPIHRDREPECAESGYTLLVALGDRTFYFTNHDRRKSGYIEYPVHMSSGDALLIPKRLNFGKFSCFHYKGKGSSSSTSSKFHYTLVYKTAKPAKPAGAF